MIYHRYRITPPPPLSSFFPYFSQCFSLCVDMQWWSMSSLFYFLTSGMPSLQEMFDQVERLKELNERKEKYLQVNKITFAAALSNHLTLFRLCVSQYLAFLLCLDEPGLEGMHAPWALLDHCTEMCSFSI